MPIGPILCWKWRFYLRSTPVTDTPLSSITQPCPLMPAATQQSFHTQSCLSCKSKRTDGSLWRALSCTSRRSLQQRRQPLGVGRSTPTTSPLASPSAMPPEVITVFKICASPFIFKRRSGGDYEMNLMYKLTLYRSCCGNCHWNGGRARLPVTLSDERFFVSQCIMALGFNNNLSVQVQCLFCATRGAASPKPWNRLQPIG